MLLSREEIWATWRNDKRRERRLLVIVCVIVALVFLACLSVRYNAIYYNDKFLPLTYAQSLWTALQIEVSHLFNGDLWYQREEVIASIGSIEYLGALARLRTCLMTFAAGAALALGGAIFQTAYRNPMASPNLLGVTAGVNLGNVVLVLMFATSAMSHVFLRYGLCYGFTAICVLLVLILGRVAGDRHENVSVIEMVMMGAIISQAIGAFVSYQMYTMEEESLALLEQIQLGALMQVDVVSFAICVGCITLACAPIAAMRYRMNVIGLERAETAAIGVNAQPYRVLAQICGVIMTTAAMVHCGQIGMVAMVVPYLVRSLVGANFKNICIFSILIGGAVVMVCSLIASFFMVGETPLPATFIVNFIMVPGFLYILAKQKGGFDAARSA